MQDLKEVREVFSRGVEAFLDSFTSFSMVSDMNNGQRESYRDMCAYVLAGGKQIRGFTIYSTARQVAMAKGTFNPAFDQDAQLTSWTGEMMQAAALMIDDVIDKGVTRRNRPCWYTLPDVGMKALWDVERSVRETHRYLKVTALSTAAKLRGPNDSNPIKISRDVMDVIIPGEVRTYAGVVLELYAMNDPISRVGLQHKIHVNKTGHYTAHAPIAWGAVLGGLCLKDFEVVFRTHILKVGEFFQELDDYLDCYASAEQVGKVGTDIQNNACTFLLRLALEKASTEQVEELRLHYGKWDDTSVNAVKDLYRRLGVKEMCEDYIEKALDQLAEDVPLVEDAAMSAVGETLNTFLFILTHHYISKKP